MDTYDFTVALAGVTRFWGQYLQSNSMPVPLFLGSLLLCCLGAGILMRTIGGKNSTGVQVLSGCFGICSLYAITVLLQILNPLELARYLSPLPFSLFRSDILILSPLTDSDFSEICKQILSLVILCFTFHLSRKLMVRPKSVLLWITMRLVTIFLAIFLNLTVRFLINQLLPGMLSRFASECLLLILGAAIMIGLFNPLLCIVFTVANPVFGLFYSFFFKNLIGRRIIEAVLSSFLLIIFLYVLECTGYLVWDISGSSLFMWGAITLLLAVIWYVFDVTIQIE